MGPKIKLLAVVSSLEGGGAERQMAILLKGIDRATFAPALCLFNRQGPYVDELPLDVPVYDLQKRSRWDLPKLVRRLGALIRDIQPDIVFSKLQYTNIITTGACKLLRQKIPLVLSEETNPREALRYARYSRLRYGLLRWAYSQADVIVTPSEGVASVLRSDFAVEDRRLRVISNAIEIERVRELAKETIGHSFFQTSEALIVTAGRLTRPKGYPYLLRAITHVNEKIPCRLLVLGDGEERENLHQLANKLGLKGKVAFWGFQKNPFTLMARANVFVLSSLWESFGNVLIEAMALGVPVVSTRAPYGPEEIIEDGKTGLLVLPGNAGALAEAIVQVLADGQLRKRLAQEGGRIAAERYDAKIIVARYEALFSELVKNSLLAQRSTLQAQVGIKL